MTDPTPAVTGLQAVASADFLLPYLYTQKKPASLAVLAKNLSAYLDQPRIEAGLETLRGRGLVSLDQQRVAITLAGSALVEKTWGGRIDDHKRLTLVWPALALGLAPAAAAARLRTTDGLFAVTLVALFNLPLKRDSATLAQVMSVLVIRGLAGRPVPPVLNDQLRPLVERLGEIGDPEALRRVLIQAALGLSAAGESAAAGAVDGEGAGEDDPAGFAARVQALADTLSSPPLTDAVAVAQVYDAYGRQHRDAGSLESFKVRLLQAHAERRLLLLTLDRPEALARPLRTRSTIEGPQRRFHLIQRRG